MSQIVERVAAALERENAAIVAEFGSGNCPAEVAYRRLSRAAIEAMREPTEGMIEAWSEAEEWTDHPVESYLNPRRYVAMIDEALR